MPKYFLPRRILFYLVLSFLVGMTGCKETKRGIAMIAGALISGYEQGLPQEMEKYNPEDYFTDPKVIELCYAIDNEDIARIDKLIADGVNVNTKGDGNMTLLLWAYPAKNPAVFAKILKAGADPNVQFERTFGSGTGLDPRATSPGSTIIGMATNEQLRLLIDAGADLNIATADGWTPLMSAVHWDYDRAIMLVEGGADWDVMEPNSDGHRTVMFILVNKDFASSTNPIPISQCLNTDYEKEKYKSYLKLVEILKERGADFDKEREYVKLYHTDTARMNIERAKPILEEQKQQTKERRSRYEQKQQLKKQQKEQTMAAE